MVRLLSVFVVVSCVTITACGDKKKNAAPAAPCATGVNLDKCATDMEGASMWARTYDVTSVDEKTKEKTVEKKVTTINEFSTITGGQQVWRRSITVTMPDGQAKSMTLEGKVQKIDQEKIYLTIDNSSCDGIDTSFRIDTGVTENGARVLYYQRNGERLSLRTKPFFKAAEVKSKGLNIFGTIVGSIVETMVVSVMRGMVDGMSEMFINMFTFGLARDQLQDGTGDFTAVKKSLPGLDNFSYGQLGCFGKKGSSEFTATKQQMLNW